MSATPYADPSKHLRCLLQQLAIFCTRTPLHLPGDKKTDTRKNSQHPTIREVLGHDVHHFQDAINRPGKKERKNVLSFNFSVIEQGRKNYEI